MSVSRSLLVVGVLVLASLALPSEIAAALEQCGPEAVTKFGRWFDPGMESVTAGHPRDSVIAGKQNFEVAGIRVLLGVTAGSSSDWGLVVRDQNYRPLASFSSNDFRDESGGFKKERWTGRLDGDHVILELMSNENTDVRIDALSAVAFPRDNENARFFSIVNPISPWQELYEENDLVDRKRAGDGVGLIIGADISAGAPTLQSWCCSGVLLSPDIMLTNWHCGGSPTLNMEDKDYWRHSVCENTLVDFGWAKGAVRRQYSCVKVLASDPDLDFALIQIAPVVGQGELVGAPIAPQLSMGVVSVDDQLFMVHHAKCALKLVSPHCQVESASYPSWRNAPAGSEFSHNCNSEPGASGAPVFNEAGKLVGLHHLGTKRNANCEATDKLNKAVSISAIVQFLKDKEPELASKLGWK